MLFSDNDCACSKSEVELFEKRNVQTVMNKAQWIDVHPLNTVTQASTPIEFTISGSPDEYIDPNDTMLHITCRIVRSNGAHFTEDDADQPVPVNNFMHSVFSDVKLIIGERQLEGGIHLYPYRAYFNNLFSFDSACKKSFLNAQGFAKDTSGKMDSYDENEGFRKRLNKSRNSKLIELCGPLCLDMLNQAKYLLSNLDVHINLIRNKSDFCLFGGAAGSRVQLESAVLYVRKVQLDPSVILSHEKALIKENAVYPIQRTQMLTYTIPVGTMSHIREGLFIGQMPKLIIFGFVSNAAYNGLRESNPFNFQHFDVNHVALYKDGSPIPFRPLTPNFKEGLCVREYVSLLQNLQYFNRNENFGLTLEDYTTGGYCFFAFNLTPDLSVSGHSQLFHQGNLRLEVQFAKALPSAINVISMAVLDGRVEITRQRNVLVDYRN
jgi:hypothetical protein